MMRGMFLFLTFLLTGSCLGMELTPQEREYLQEHPVARIAIHPNWPPFEWVDSTGVACGIAPDMQRRISERTGLKFEYLHGAGWEDSVQLVREGKADLLSFINSTPERDTWLIYTSVMLDDTNIFATRDTHPFITDPATLRGETLVLPRGTSFPEAFQKDYPNLRLLQSETDEEALQMVADGRADVTMRSFLSTAYHIRRDNLYSIKIAGLKPEYANHLRIGVRKDLPVLRAILERGIAEISEPERRAILSFHSRDEQEAAPDYRLLGRVAAVFALILGVGVYWSYRLRKYNRLLLQISQTDKLTGLYNRMKIDELLLQEATRAFRYSRPFAIIMLDVDFFKKANDDLGHQAGDRILISIAGSIQSAIRNTDFVGRWGGEEFLVLCPETDLEAARIAGERIAQAVRAATYPGGRKQTISAGVAEFHRGESADRLLKRADDALYRAKHEGRDRVCLAPAPPADEPSAQEHPAGA